MRLRRDARSRNLIAGERRVRQNVADRVERSGGTAAGAEKRLREVSAKHPLRGKNGKALRVAPFGERLIVGREKQFVAENAAAHHRSVVVAPQRLLLHQRVFEEVARVEFFVAEEVEQRAVKIVGAGTDRRNDLGAGLSAEFGRVESGLDLELLQRFDGRAEPHGGVERGANGRAVQQEPVVVHLLAHGGDAEAGAEAGRGDTRSGAAAHSRAEQRQHVHVALAGDGQLADLALVDQLANGGVVGREQRRRALHRDFLSDGAHFELNVDARPLTHYESNPADHFAAEARLLDRHFVKADVERRHFVIAARAGRGRAPFLGAGVSDGHHSAGDGRAAPIGDLAENAGAVALRVRGDRGDDDGQGCGREKTGTMHGSIIPAPSRGIQQRRPGSKSRDPMLPGGGRPYRWR